MKYYGTVTITLSGWFEADGIAEIQSAPMTCATNCTIETEAVYMKEVEADGGLAE